MKRFLLLTFCIPSLLFANSGSQALVQFWKNNPRLDSMPTAKLTAALNEMGISDANALSDHLDSEDSCAQTLASMWALSPSTPQLGKETLERLWKLRAKFRPETEEGKYLIKLLVSYADDVGNLSTYCMSVPVASGNKMLAWLGEYAGTNATKKLKVVRLAGAILGIRYGYAAGGMFDNYDPRKDSIGEFASAVNWPLYGEPEVAQLSFDIAFARMTGRYRKILDQEGFERSLDFILVESKAPSGFLVEKTREMCCGDRNLASLVYWKICQLKDKSPVAAKIYSLAPEACVENKEVFQSIQTGKLGKEKAFDLAVRQYRETPYTYN